jgi:ribose/xylose/arabinose/galactoside ABC-type transport system permease subunit
VDNDTHAASAEKMRRPRSRCLLLVYAAIGVLASSMATAQTARVVATPTELAAAVAAGVTHIMIADHIDLTDPSAAACGSVCDSVKLAVSSSTKSIQVCVRK